MLHIKVCYIDDCSIKHICVINNFADLYFLQERYTVIDYEVIQLKKSFIDEEE